MSKTATEIDELDASLLSEVFLRNPYPTLDRLRVVDPAHWSEGIGGWVLTRYDDLLVTFKDTTSYSSEGRLLRALEHLPHGSRQQLVAFESHFGSKGLIHSDPPDHTRLRRLVLKAFSPRAIQTMQPRIQRIVDELVDDAASAGEIDVIRDLAFAVPITVLTQMLGVPRSDGVAFRHWADQLLAFQGINKPSLQLLLGAQEALIEARAYLTALVNERRGRPGDDLISHMLTRGDSGQLLSEDEIVNTGITLLIAGHETTTSLIGNGLYTLLRHPAQWDELKRDRSLIDSAIEEILRFESPVARQPRLVRSDTQLRGRSFKAGETVFQMLNAANRDPAIFRTPETFDIHRTSNRHIAFGQGAHFCIGAPLARAEGQIVFQTILDRLPSIHLVSDRPDWDLEKANSRVLRTLQVRF